MDPKIELLDDLYDLYCPYFDTKTSQLMDEESQKPQFQSVPTKRLSNYEGGLHV